MTIHQNVEIDYRSLCYPNIAKFKNSTCYLLITFIGHDRTKVLKISFPNVQCGWKRSLQPPLQRKCSVSMDRGTSKQIFSQRKHNCLFQTKIKDTYGCVSTNVYFLTLISSKGLRQFFYKICLPGMVFSQISQKKTNVAMPSTLMTFLKLLTFIN